MKQDIPYAIGIAIGMGVIAYGSYKTWKFQKEKKRHKKEIKFIDEMYEFEGDELRILMYHNSERAVRGTKRLVGGKYATFLARARVEEMIRLNELSHSEAQDDFQNALDLGVDTIGENIAYGHGTWQGVCNSWKLSKGHFENILNPKYDFIGIAIGMDKFGRKYYCVIFLNEDEIE